MKIFIENVATLTWIRSGSMGSSLNIAEDSIYLSHEHKNCLCEIIWTQVSGTVDEALKPKELNPPIISTAYTHLEIDNRTIAPDATHRLLSRLATQFTEKLKNGSQEVDARRINPPHFCVVGEDLHILLGLMLNIAENERAFHDGNLDNANVATWRKAISRLEKPFKIRNRHSNFLVPLDRRLMNALMCYKNVDTDNCITLRDRLISFVTLSETFSNKFVPSNASFESIEKKSSSIIEQAEKYLVQVRGRKNYKDVYIIGVDGVVRLVPIHMYLAFFLLKANKVCKERK